MNLPAKPSKEDLERAVDIFCKIRKPYDPISISQYTYKLGTRDAVLLIAQALADQRERDAEIAESEPCDGKPIRIAISTAIRKGDAQ